jgi:hypothetical protein
MSIRCALGFHTLHVFAPLYNECVRCGQAFYTDYFESRATGRMVRIPGSREEADRARRPSSQYSSEGGAKR